MIKVKRPADGIPARLDLTNPASKASEELQLALDAIANDAPLKSKDFKAYKSNAIKAALITMFKGKCAYCESNHAASGDIDIEHYRPKGQVAESPDHPGYWWLAGRWDNLVMSCTHCNQNRTVEVVLEGEGGPVIETETKGKLDAFPTLDEVWIMDHNEDVIDEHPVLIDPTVSDPEDLLDYVFHDNEFCTIFGTDADKRGQKTIEILGLNRRLLTEARFLRQLTLTDYATRISKFLDRYINATSDEIADQALEDLDDNLEGLRREGLDNRSYAGMCRAFYFKQLDIVDQALALDQ